MIILKLILSLVLLIIIPELIGLLFTRFLKEDKHNFLMAFVIGYLVEFALCQILAVPMIYARAKFTTLFYSYIALLLVLSVVSFIINCKSFKEIFIDNGIKKIKNMPLTLIVVLVLVLGQTYMLCRYMHTDEDDAFYVGTATTSIDTNSLFQYDASTGKYNSSGKLPARYTLGPFPLFIAIISYCININPAIVAHTIMPAIFIPLVYIIYALIANELFKKDKKSVCLFLIFMSVIYIWGNYSLRNNFTFLLFRIWQGKAVLANIIIPAVWLLFIKAYKNDFDFTTCLLLAITMFAGCLTTTMGIIMPLITLLALAFIFSIKDKNVKNFIKCSICCIPCLIYGISFLLL